MSSLFSAHYICAYDMDHPLAFYKELAERVQRDVFPNFCISPSFVSKKYRNLVTGADLTQCFVTGSIDYQEIIGDKFGRNRVAAQNSAIQRKNYPECPQLYYRDRERYDVAKAFAKHYISFARVENNWHSDFFTRPHSDAVFLVAIDLAKKLHTEFQLPIHTICFTTMGLEYSTYSLLEAYYSIRESKHIIEREVWQNHVLPWQRVHIVYPHKETVLRNLDGIISTPDLPCELVTIRSVQQKYGRCS